jgi:uncharacterized protein YecE (DUF72 family)
MSQIFLGTSGWVYKDWPKKFYPKGLPVAQRAAYFSTQFNTVEINGSFYGLLPAKSYERWRAETGENFRLSVKVSKTITHIQRMKDVRLAWEKFLETTLPLKEKRGPYLFQFPSSFSGTPEEIRRINDFLGSLKNDSVPVQCAFEFRHQNCFSEDMQTVLKTHRAALVLAHSSEYPGAPLIDSADFTYIRLHGPEKLFSSSYSEAKLSEWAATIKDQVRKKKDVYVYFNNDLNANAPADARLLQKLLSKE